MNKEEKLSIGLIKRIAIIAIILIILLGVGVIAGTSSLNSVKIVFSDNTELTVVTSKSNISEILEENNIILLEDENVKPGLDENLDGERKIVIYRGEDTEAVTNVTIDPSEAYSDKKYKDKIFTEQVEIPFETITKEVSSSESGENDSKILQEGENGIKEITYKAKFLDDVEVQNTREVISEEVIKEPVDKIVQVSAKVTSRSESVSRSATVEAYTGSLTDYQEYARQRCYAYGWTDNDFNCLVALWNKESGWNPYAMNSYSGAYGIPQALPAGKMASAGDDYLTNGNTQIEWGLSYISGRYGSPSSAYYHSQTTGWY